MQKIIYSLCNTLLIFFYPFNDFYYASLTTKNFKGNNSFNPKRLLFTILKK